MKFNYVLPQYMLNRLGIVLLKTQDTDFSSFSRPGSFELTLDSLRPSFCALPLASCCANGDRARSAGPFQ